MSVTAIDASGKVLLPEEIRCQLGLNEGDKFLVESLGGNTIVLKKMDTRQLFEKWLSV